MTGPAPVTVTLTWGSSSNSPPGTFVLTIQASWLDKTGAPKVATIKSGLINQAANPELQAAAVSPVTVNLLQNLLAAVLNA